MTPCCASPTTGQITAAPPMSVMNSRRLMGLTRRPRIANKCSRSEPSTAAKAPTHVRFGSLADIAAAFPNVRFTPESGRHPKPSSCPISAKTEHGGSFDQVERIEGRHARSQYWAFVPCVDGSELARRIFRCRTSCGKRTISDEIKQEVGEPSTPRNSRIAGLTHTECRYAAPRRHGERRKGSSVSA